MREQLLLEAKMPAGERKKQVGAALQKALNMPFLRTQGTVRGGIEKGVQDAAEKPTYHGDQLSRAALNQVKFKTGQAR